MLIRLGFPRAVVAFLGRWGSDAVLKYIEEVTALGVALDLPEAPVNPFGDQEIAQVWAGSTRRMPSKVAFRWSGTDRSSRSCAYQT